MNNILKIYKLFFYNNFLDSTEWWYDDLFNVWILATGWPEEWWSWAGELIEKILSWEFVKVNKVILITNYTKWWVVKIFDKYEEKLKKIDVNLEIEIVEDFPERWNNDKFTPENEDWIKNKYGEIVRRFWLDYLVCSWWMKQILWLNPSISQNIHPGPTKKPYGWLKKYWDIVHKMVWEDYKKWIIKTSCVTMHFVIPELDRWPITLQIPVPICCCESWKDVKEEVNKAEHKYQWIVYKMLFEWKISWSWVKWEDVKINMEEVKKYDFPEGTWFGKEINLKKGVSYREAKKQGYSEWIPDIT